MTPPRKRNDGDESPERDHIRRFVLGPVYCRGWYIGHRAGPLPFDADAECEHGKLPSDGNIECDCWGLGLQSGDFRPFWGRVWTTLWPVIWGSRRG